MYGQSGIRFSTREALNTPFICLNEKLRPQSAWKVRILLDGFCGLLSYKHKKPTKCMYCEVDNPYKCMFRDSAQKILFEKLFTNGYKNRSV